MKGNLRPQSTMSQPCAESLPSARIRCNAGRIQVGSRTYQSASDALSAYMQQFQPEQPGPSAQNSSLDAVIKKNARSVGSSAVHKKCEPANVSGLLTGSLSYAHKNGVTLEDTVSAGSPVLLNGIGSAQKSAKHSVSFVLPDSADDSLGRSKLSATVGVSGSSQNLSSPRLHSSSQFDSKLPYSLTSNSITQNGSSDLLGLTQLNNTSATRSHYNSSAGRSLPNSNGFVDNGLSALSSSLAASGEQPKQTDLHGHTNSSGQAQVDSRRAKSEVEMLLTEALSQSELNSLSQLSGGERKLSSLLRETSVPESSSTSSDKSALQQEVEEALSRSAQLLETIKTDVLVSPRCVSDAGSLSTDVLLSINPQNPAESIPALQERESRSRHRYSYHTPAHQPRSLSVDPVMDGSEHRAVPRSGRRRSVDSLDSVGLGKDRFADLNESMSALSDSGGILKRLVTAGVGSLSGVTADSKEMNPGAAGQTGPPSWIQELIAPVSTHPVNRKDLTDSLFSKRDVSGGRKTPSWVNGLEQSDIASSVGTQDLHDAADSLVLGKGRKLHGADTVKKAFEAAILADDSVASELSYAGPGLNYSDLLPSPAAANKGKGTRAAQLHHKPSAKVSRTSSFSGVGNSPSVRRGVDRSKPPVTMSRIFQDLAGVDATRPKSHNLSPDLSSSLGADSSASLLRRKVCDDSVEAKSSLDKYLSQVAGEVEDEAGERARRMEQMLEIPLCSSMNQLNGMGDHPDVLSNVTGASSITKDSNFSSKLCLDDPTLTPARQSRAMSAARGPGGERGVEGMGDDDADPDLLDGDRPWESELPSFKDPVYVGSTGPAGASPGQGRPETPTLSGGQQPGSMEALKQMLFRLQHEESSSATPPAAAAAAMPQGNGETMLVPALKDYDFVEEPGGQSLERALVHLGRLKTLVQTGTAPAQSSSATQEQMS